MPPKSNRPDLKHGWEVRMHHEMPTSDNLILHPKDSTQAQCPCCGMFVERFRLVDVSTLPVVLTSGNKWACDGCWTRWEREEILLPDGRNFDEEVMYEMMGAPQALLDEVRQTVVKHRIQTGKEKALPGEDAITLEARLLGSYNKKAKKGDSSG